MRLLALLLVACLGWLATLAPGRPAAVAVAGAFLAGAFLWPQRSPTGQPMGSPARPPTPQTVATLDDEARRRVEALMRDGRKIEAIKEVRELTGLSLIDAKDFVDAMPISAPGR